VLLGTSGLAERVTRNDKSRNAAHVYSAPLGPSEHVHIMFKNVLLWSAGALRLHLASSDTHCHSLRLVLDLLLYASLS
jgi:hypothetical protein